MNRHLVIKMASSVLYNFSIALLLRAFHALNQAILTDNLFDPGLIRGSLV